MTSVENKMNTEINTPSTTAKVEVVKTKKVRKPKEEAVVEPIKEVKEELQIENFDDELAEQEKIIKEAQAKTAELRLKKQLTEKAPEFLEKIIQRKKRSLKGAEERMKEAVEAWEKEIAEIEGDLETLEAIDLDEDDVMGFLADNYAEEVNGFLAVIYPETKKTETKKAEGAKRKTGVVTKTMKPADRWALIEEGTQFRAKQKDFIRYYKKVEEGVMECNEIGTLLQGSTIYAGNQEAANAFRLAAGIPYSISGWEFLQLYNPHTDKAKSLKKWDGDVDYLLW